MDTEKYKAAIETHKFYDTISNSIIAGQLAITGGAFYVYEKIQGKPIDYLLFIITACCVVILLFIYRRCAYYANVARNVAADLENKKDIPGVSVALKTKTHPAEKNWIRGIYGMVHLLSIVLILGLVTSSTFIAFNKYIQNDFLICKIAYILFLPIIFLGLTVGSCIVIERNCRL